MSQSHIPQPDASAPGEQIASTDVVLPMTNIEITSPSTSQEAPIAMGEINTLDTYFYTQFRQIAKIRWSVQDVAGKLLWYVPLNPLYMDENLAYVSKMYLSWAGDFVFNFKVAGTGFHAGMLTFVKLPPTISPEQVTNPQQFTLMPWDAVDPKMLEIGSMMGRDIRPIKYHYTQKQDNAPDDYYIGGYLALYVDIPLNTSASGTPRIEIAVWTKLAPNYRVSFMVPHSLQTLNAPALVPPFLAPVLKFSRLYTDEYISSYPTVVDKILFLPSTVKIFNRHLYSCITLDDKALSKYWDPATLIVKDINFPMEAECKNWGETADTCTFDVSDYSWMGMPSQTVSVVTRDFGMSGTMDITKIEDKDGKVHITGTKVSGSIEVGRTVYIYLPTKNPKDSTIVDNELKALVDSESFMVFAAGIHNYACPQFNFLSRTFAANRSDLMQWLPPGESAIFQVVESSTELPLTMCKLYRQGFFTVPATVDQMVFDFHDIELKFLFQQPATSVIPSNTFATNMRMAAHVHKKRLKKSK